MSEKKFTEEELKQVNTLQGTYLNLQNALGQISIGRIRVEQQLDDFDKAEDNVRKEFAETQQTEKDFIEVYEGDTLQANNRAKFENSKLKTKFIEKFGSNFDGFLNGPNDPQESTLIKNALSSVQYSVCAE